MKKKSTILIAGLLSIIVCTGFVTKSLVVPAADSANNNTVMDAVGNKTDTVSGNSAISLVKIADAAIDVVDGLHDVPTADVATNTTMRDVVGNKTDAASDTADEASIVAMVRQALADLLEIKTHNHSGERWFGAAASPSGETHLADRVGAGAAGAEAAPIVIDAGNDDWGTWTQILGSDDTPTDGGSKTAFDFHLIVVEAAEDTAQRYIMQIALQEDAPADDPGASDTYTEFELISPGIGATAQVQPFHIQCDKVAAGTKVWARTRAPDQNTSTISFYFGLHEYD